MCWAACVAWVNFSESLAPPLSCCSCQSTQWFASNFLNIWWLGLNSAFRVYLSVSIIPIFVYEAFDKRTRNPFLLLSTKSSGLGATPAQFSCLGNFCQGEESSFNHRHFYRNTHYKKKLCVIVAVVMSCLHGIVDLLTQIGTCPILYQRKIRYVKDKMTKYANWAQKMPQKVARKKSAKV